MRKLATIREVTNIKEITNADRIEVAIITKWECIVSKNEFKIGDIVVFIEPDSLIPKEIKEFDFLDKYCKTKKVNGKEYYLLGTTVLRGQPSQGVILHIEDFNKLTNKKYSENDIGLDVSDDIGIIKYDPSEVDNPSNSTEYFVDFPYFIKKTDEERIQNLDFIPRLTYEITEKLDGTSCSIYHKDGKTGICSRNRELLVNKLSSNDIYSEVYNKYYKLFKMERFHNNYMDTNIAIQGEIIGPKIQKNPYKLDKREFYVFDIFNIDNQTYFTPEEVYWFCKDFNLNHVPVIDSYFHYNELMEDKDLFEFSYGNSFINPDVKKEGVVFKSTTEDTFSFKIINIDYLLKGKR
jgi:RNA ligase (TIGR02306 family)